MDGSVASMAARLATKLSLNNQEEPMHLGDLRCPDSGFVALRFYLVGVKQLIINIQASNISFSCSWTKTGELIGGRILD